MSVNPFQARFVLEDEFNDYGLPDVTQQPDIVTLVERASTLIDEYCSRTDLDAQGSLVWSTYVERIGLPVGRNIFRVTYRPMSTVDGTTVTNLIASASVSGEPNYYYTGVQPNTSFRGSMLSPIIAASGRYGYARRGQQQVYPDLNYAANVLQVASFFGGPPQFTTIDVTSCDYDPKTGEIWVPAGLYLSQYTEVLITYNSGFNPLKMPPAIKHATVSVVRNLLARGGGATGLKSIRMGMRGVMADFSEQLIDVNLQNLLQAYRTVRAS